MTIERKPATDSGKAGTDLRPGDRVRLRPRGSSDVFDLVLQGMEATVDRIEVDLEGRVHVAVLIDDDPGRDLGEEGRPGHRFFYDPAELEPIPPPAGGAP